MSGTATVDTGIVEPLFVTLALRLASRCARARFSCAARMYSVLLPGPPKYAPVCGYTALTEVVPHNVNGTEADRKLLNPIVLPVSVWIRTCVAVKVWKCGQPMTGVTSGTVGIGWTIGTVETSRPPVAMPGGGP